MRSMTLHNKLLVDKGAFQTVAINVSFRFSTFHGPPKAYQDALDVAHKKLLVGEDADSKIVMTSTMNHNCGTAV